MPVFRCRVTTVPEANGAVHVGGQSIPAGWLVTCTDESNLATVSGCSPGSGELWPKAAALGPGSVDLERAGV